MNIKLQLNEDSKKQKKNPHKDRGADFNLYTYKSVGWGYIHL